MPLPGNCWWETGHEVIARIAVAHLTPAALQSVADLLDVENNPEAVANALAEASIWADEIKGDTQTGNWHFIDLTLQDGKEDIPERCENDNCVTARIRIFAANLAAGNTAADSRWSDLDALRFVVHFVGDLHQPLHAISDADQGGNCELLDPVMDQAKNLHALWDGYLVNAIGTDDKELAADLETEIQAMSSSRRKSWAEGNPDEWAWESHKLAHSSIYRRLHIPKEAVLFPAKCSEAPEEITGLRLHIEDSYIDSMKPVVREQLIKAGLRLAKLLNDSLGG